MAVTVKLISCIEANNENAVQRGSTVGWCAGDVFEVEESACENFAKNETATDVSQQLCSRLR